MREKTQTALTFLYGAAAWPCVEVLYRGRTHPSMAVVGGLALVICRSTAKHFAGRPLLVRAVVCGGAITGLELAGGLLLNRVLGLEVWDYSARPGNLWGQICPAFSLAWTGLSVPALWYFSTPLDRRGGDPLY